MATEKSGTKGKGITGFVNWVFANKKTVAAGVLALAGILVVSEQVYVASEIRSVVESLRHQRELGRGVFVNAEFIEKNIGSESVKLTEHFGGGDTILVSSDDKKFDYMISNYKNSFDRSYDDPYHDGAGPDLRWFSEEFDDSRFVRFSSGATREELNVAMDYSSLKSEETTAAAMKTGPGDTKQVSFITTANSNFAYVALNDIDGIDGFPFRVSHGELDSMTLYHEVSHVRDSHMLERIYSRSSKLYGISLSKEEGSVISEAIADLSSSLISLRETGNRDIYNSIIKPFRLARSKIAGHSTYHLLSTSFEGVSFDDVKGKTDVELMALSQKMIESKVLRLAKEFQRNPDGVFFDTLVGLSDQNSKMRYFEERIGAAIQNGSYMGVLDKAMVKKIIEHAEKDPGSVHDAKLCKAVDLATSGKDFDVKRFAAEMNFDIDWTAHARRDSNMTIMSEHYKEATGLSIGFKGVEVPVNHSALLKLATGQKQEVRKGTSSDFEP